MDKTNTRDYEGIFYLHENSITPEESELECLDIIDYESRVIFLQIFDKDIMHPLKSTTVYLTEAEERISAKTDNNGILKIEDLTEHFYLIEVNGKEIEIQTYAPDEIAKPLRIYLGSDELEFAKDADDVNTFYEDEDGYIDNDFIDLADQNDYESDDEEGLNER